MLAVALTAGMAVAIAVHQIALGLYRDPLILASVAGYATAIGAMLVAARRRYGRSDSTESAAALPSLACLLDGALPSCKYGALYMVLVLLPHALAWTAAVHSEPDWVTAATSFEVALTVALVPIVLTGGLAERSARLFWLSARSALRVATIVRPQAFSEGVRRFYATQVVRYLVVLILVSSLAYAAFSTTFASRMVRTIVPGTDASLVQVIFASSLVAYLLLGWGLFNCIFIVGLGRPTDATRPLALGILATLVAGAPLAFGSHYGYAVVRLRCGRPRLRRWFILGSSNATHFRDYHYYAST